jgi:GntR family transcriptional regulator / MocR family aminotransferase
VAHGARGTHVASSVPHRSDAILPVAPPPDRPAVPAIPAHAPRPFQMGLPALDAFPRKTWSRLAGRAVRDLATASLAQHPAPGLAVLRRAIAGYLGLARGVACTADQVLVLGGFQRVLALVAAALLRPGDQIWIEDPGYFLARDALAALGSELVPVGIDREGLDVAAGVAAAPRARVAVVTPTHQFPLGSTLSLRRRIALLEWARSAGSWIVEDDYDGEFHYAGRPLPALYGLDSDSRVLFAGTFSKVLFPSLRLAYLVVPPADAERFGRLHGLLEGNASLIDQTTVAAFMDEGHFTRHIGRMRRLYAERRSALAAALAATLGERFAVAPASGGMHVVLRLPPGWSDVEAAAGLYAAGLAGRALSTLAIRSDPGQALLLSFTNIPAEQAVQHAERLRRVLLE